MAKGQAFERLLAKRISLWWTQDAAEPSDEIFWRSANSGGRATSRCKIGKRTRQHYGDLAPIDPCGFALTELLVIEAKNGYARAHIGEMIDRLDTSKESVYDAWFSKAEANQDAAHTWAWLLIHHRTRRETLAYFPHYVWQRLKEIGAFAGRNYPLVTIMRSVDKQHDVGGICGVRWDDFLAGVHPKHIRQLSATWKQDSD